MFNQEEVHPALTIRLLNQLSRVRILYTLALLVGAYTVPPKLMLNPALAYGSVAMMAILAMFSYFAADWRREHAQGRLNLAVALSIIGDVFVISLFMWATGNIYSHFLILLLCDVVFAGIFFHGLELFFIVGIIALSFTNSGLLHGFTMARIWQAFSGIAGAIIIAWLSGGLGRVLRLERSANERILNDIARPVCLIDDRRRVVLANPHFERLVETPVTELIGRSLDELSVGERLGRCQQLLGDMDESLEARTVHEDELEIPDPTNGVATAVRRVVPCEVDFGEPPGWLITWEIKHRDEEKVRAMEEGVMVVSHELKGPISSLKVLVEVLQGVAGEINEAKRQQVVSLLASETERLSRLVASILELSRFERPDFTVERSEVDIYPVLERVRGLFNPKAQQIDVNFECSFPDGPIPVNCAPDRIEQVFVNLCENAMTYTPSEGTVRFEAVLEDGQIKCTVSDTGPGIPQERLGVIFDKFTRGGNEPPPGRQREFGQGMGIGLALAKRIVDLHDGDIFVESEEGEGATFTVILPVCDVPVEDLTVAG